MVGKGDNIVTVLGANSDGSGALLDQPEYYYNPDYYSAFDGCIILGMETAGVLVIGTAQTGEPWS